MHEVRACETARNQRKEREMTLDTDKIDDAALAILSLTVIGSGRGSIGTSQTGFLRKA